LKLDLKTIRIKDSISIFRQIKGEPIYACQSEQQVDNIFAEENDLLDNNEAGKKFIVGYQLQPGKGKIIFLGCAPKPEIIAAIHRIENIPIYCHAGIPNVLSALFQKNDEQYYLIIVNNGNENRDVRIWLAPYIFANSTWEMIDLFSLKNEQVAFNDTPNIITQMGLKDGTVLELRRKDF